MDTAPIGLSDLSVLIRQPRGLIRPFDRFCWLISQSHFPISATHVDSSYNHVKKMLKPVSDNRHIEPP